MRLSMAFLAALLLTTVNSAFGQRAISISDQTGPKPHGAATASQWREAAVYPSREHFELRFGHPDDDWDSWQPVARIGQPVNGVFPVEFVGRNGEAESEMLSAVKSQLNYYIVELGQPDPWAYAIYHTNTLANLYSRVHWLHVRPRAATDSASAMR